MNRLKLLREKENMKQSELGKLLNVKDAAISKYESGKVPLTADTLIVLSKIFNESIDYILGISDTPNSINKNEGISRHTLAKQLSNLIEEDPDVDLDFYSQASHIDATTLQKYINGEAFPTSYDLCKLVEIFDTTADYLFGKSTIAHPIKAHYVVKNNLNFPHMLEVEMNGNYLESELADKLDISISKIRKLLDGEELPTPKILESISQIFMKSTDYILGISEHSREPDDTGHYPFHMDSESIKRLQNIFGDDWNDYDAYSLGLTCDEFYMMYHFGFIPHISVLHKICKHYNVSSDYILNLSDSRLCIEITEEKNEDDLVQDYRKLDKHYRNKVNGFISEQIIQQERDSYMRSSVAADEQLPTGTTNLGK